MSSPSEPVSRLRPLEAARMQMTAYLREWTGGVKDAIRFACATSAAALGVERVGVWLFIDQQTGIRCVNLFEASKGEHSEGTILHVSEFPNYFSTLLQRRSVSAEFAVTDPRTAELADAYLRPLGITSMLDAGIFTAGQIAGVVCHEHIGPPREWSTEDRDFAASVADFLAIVLESDRARELRIALQTQVDRLAALEKADALAQMAAGIAHDFNNMLAVAQNYAEVLAARDDLPPDAREQAREIYNAALRSTALVRELLEFARPQGSAPAALNPADAAEAFLPMLRAALTPRHQLRLERCEAVGQVLMDRTQFNRILLNLVMNARDATPSGGDIDVRIAPERIHDGSATDSHFVLLEVSDRGIGMDEATQQRIFEPFFTTKAKGTGLGLSIVQRIVNRAGGFIRVQSAVGRGTRVQVFLPRVGTSLSEAA